jgi:hypothetical protein
VDPDAPDLPRLKRYFTESEQLTVDARKNALIALDYYDSDQFTREELSALDLRGQPAIVINRIKPAINGIIGVTEKGRSDPRAWPRNPGDDDSADAATDVLRYIADFNRFKRLKQDCFRDMLVPGTMAALIGVDGDKQVTITQVRWEEHFHDPRSRRNDFKDARYQGIAKWMYADDAAALYPDKADEIIASIDNGPAGLGQDQSFQDRPLQGPSMGGAWVDRKQRRLMVIEIYRREAVPGTSPGMTWRRTVFTGSDILEDGPSPYLDHKGRPDCPIEAMSAYVKRDNARYGAVWDMIGPQDEVNKRRSKSVHLLSTTRIEVADPQAFNVDADAARTQPDTGTIQQEAFIEPMQLVGSSPIYQQQVPLSTLIQLSPIPHKRSVLDVIKQGAAAQQQSDAQAQAEQQAKIGETQARTQLHGAKAQEAGASGFANQ